MFGKYMKYSIFYYLKKTKKQYYLAISNLQDMSMLIIRNLICRVF